METIVTDVTDPIYRMDSTGPNGPEGPNKSNYPDGQDKPDRPWLIIDKCFYFILITCQWNPNERGQEHDFYKGIL